MNQSNTASSSASASSAPAITTSQAGRVLSQAVPPIAKKSGLEKKQEQFSNPKTTIFEKVLMLEELAKQCDALTPTMIGNGMHESGELGFIPAADDATELGVATPYSMSYGVNAANDEFALVAKPKHGREVVNGNIGQPGENMGKMSNMKSCFGLTFVNGLTSIAKHKVVKAMIKAFGRDNCGFVYDKATGEYTSKMLFGRAAWAAAKRQRQIVNRDNGLRKRHAEKQRLSAAKAAKPPRTKQTKEEKNARARARRAEKKAAGAAGPLTKAQLSAKIDAQRVAFEAEKAKLEALEKAVQELEPQPAQPAQQAASA